MGENKKKENPNDASQETVNAFLTGWISIFGTPRVVMTDPDPIFTGGVFAHFLQDNKIEYLTTASKHHQSIGQVERKHAAVRSLLESLTKIQNIWKVETFKK